MINRIQKLQFKKNDVFPMQPNLNSRASNMQVRIDEESNLQVQLHLALLLAEKHKWKSKG